MAGITMPNLSRAKKKVRVRENQIEGETVSGFKKKHETFKLLKILKSVSNQIKTVLKSCFIFIKKTKKSKKVLADKEENDTNEE